VLIRCEKCSTVYELDEKVLPASGAPVQCSRCQYIFTAYPSAPASTPAPTPAAAPLAFGAPTRSASPGARASAPVEGEPASASSPAAAPKGPGSGSDLASVARAGETAEPSGAAIDDGAATVGPARSASPTSPPYAVSRAPQARDAGPQLTADGRPIRKVPFPQEEPSTPQQRTFPRPASVSTGRPGGLLRWLVPLAVIVAIAAAIAAWRMASSRRTPPEAAQRRDEGHSLLLRDDRVSLARAAIAFEDAARIAPWTFQAQADRVLARALVLGHVLGEAERFDLRAAALDRGDDAPLVGPEDPARIAARSEAARLRADGEAARGRAGQLERDAQGELAPLLREHPSDPAVLRAEALLAAFAREPARADDVVRRARAAGPRDAWVDLAEAAAGVRAASPERRAEGAARAEALSRAHPEMLRARVLLAVALGRSGRPGEAASALDAVLAANPAHEDARAFKAALLAGAAPKGSEAVPGDAPPAGTPGLLPRKTLSHAAVEAEG
jgi:predicted Zn finger-like uncharacterized protein